MSQSLIARGHKKTVASPRFFYALGPSKLVAATSQAKERQQALEDIVNIEVETQSRADVVGLATIQNAFDVVEHIQAEDANAEHRDRHKARSAADEDIDDGAKDDHQRP